MWTEAVVRMRRGREPWPPRVLLVVENVSLARDHRLRKQAEALVEEGYRVSVICPRNAANREYEYVRLHDYPAPPEAQSKLGFVREYGWSWAAAAWLTTKVFFTEGFDAIQISGTPDIYFTIAAPFKLLGRPIVLDQRDLSPELYEVRYGRRGTVYRILRLLERASYRAADHVVTVNGSLERVAYRRGDLPAGAVSVVGNGPRLERTHRRPARSDLRHGRRHLACWLGLMGPQDRLDLMLRAIDHLVHQLGRTDCHFALVGDGEARESAQRLAGELGVADYVSFPGWATEDDAFAYLSTADIGLEPNMEEIVSPVKGMEYMAFGLPFVAFDLTETRAMAGDAAGYAPPGDVGTFAKLIDELLDDDSLRRRMGDEGRQRVEDSIAWDHQRSRYLQVYGRLLRSPTALVQPEPDIEEVAP
jgi:glycosyltransferase involved in cell wall biosynthesis